MSTDVTTASPLRKIGAALALAAFWGAIALFLQIRGRVPDPAVPAAAESRQ